MSYPNVPLGISAWQRKISQAVNYLLNKLEYNNYIVVGSPTAGQSILKTRFPLPLTLSDLSGWTATTATADAVVTLKVDGSAIATLTFLAGRADALSSITAPDIPADTDFEIIAPDPQDATLADFTITLGTSS